MKFSNCDQRASTDPNSFPTYPRLAWRPPTLNSETDRVTHRDDALQVSVQSVDVLENLLHALSITMSGLALREAIEVPGKSITHHRDFSHQFLALLFEDSRRSCALARARRLLEPGHWEYVGEKVIGVWS